MLSSIFKFKSSPMLVVLVSFLLLAGCDSGPSLEQKLATANSLQHRDATLNEIYQRTCKNCHVIESTGAPLTGDKGAWAERLEKGKEALVNSVIYGSGGMPPFGLCMECDAQQFEKLIDFMAQQ